MLGQLAMTLCVDESRQLEGLLLYDEVRSLRKVTLQGMSMCSKSRLERFVQLFGVCIQEVLMQVYISKHILMALTSTCSCVFSLPTAISHHSQAHMFDVGAEELALAVDCEWMHALLPKLQ